MKTLLEQALPIPTANTCHEIKIENGYFLLYAKTLLDRDGESR
jgi:hypothetical protein